MQLTNSYIETAVTLGGEYASQGWSEYFAQRKKGIVCKDKLIEFGVLFAFIKAVENYDVTNEDNYCLTAWEATKIANAIENIATLLNSGPISFETYFLLCEDGDNMMTEDGDYLVWI